MRIALPLLAAVTALAPLVHAAAAESKCSYAEAAALPIRYAGDGLAPTIEGEIDAKPARFLVETASNATLLTRSAILKRGLAMRRSDVQAYGVGGRTTLYQVKLNDVAVGRAHSGRVTLQALGDIAASPSYDAIVGAPFLMQMDLEIALADKQMRLLKPIGCGDAFLGYWSQNVIYVPFRVDGEDAPVPHFTVELNGTKMDAVIDSGTTISVIERDAAKRAGLEISAPGVTELPRMRPTGPDAVRHWSAMAKTLVIGGETMRNMRIGIMESRGLRTSDVILGADFLRAHHVLFAMAQKRLYFSYEGGELSASDRDTLEPWIRKEADAGNPDAQLYVARRYLNGRGVERDPALAAMWMDKAAQQGLARAGLLAGRQLMLAGRYGEAAARMHGALGQMPGERFGAFWRYLARVRAGEQAAAAPELAATFKAQDDDAWPAPIADFYLGQIDAAALLAKAGKPESKHESQLCEARYYMAESRAAQPAKPGETQAAPLPDPCEDAYN